ncbi:hypothetical protein ECH_0190 [Ehrlichia chaffeensis str. Arkansas]|uniref:Uncharacterized protein n=1 Tax=Ehrlichia chaffeensis (strain ATCC CRL-10679 / Arkansas) TaxID=205920 RepID=Q2GHR9_EHRCR|nr:hypothetical protein ECH_0190 [Ehrlichia chaffeensis str. Arkansas]
MFIRVNLLSKSSLRHTELLLKGYILVSCTLT